MYPILYWNSNPCSYYLSILRKSPVKFACEKPSVLEFFADTTVISSPSQRLFVQVQVSS